MIIRRPMIYVTLSFAAGILAVFYMGIWQAAAMALSAVLFILLYDHRLIAEKASVLICISFILGVLCLTVSEAEESVLSGYEEQYTELTCRIITKEIRTATAIDGSSREYAQLKMRIKTVNNIPVSGSEKLLVKYYGSEEKSEEYDEENGETEMFIPGQDVRIGGSAERPAGRRNPGCFDYALYLKSIGISCILQAESIELCEKEASESFMHELCQCIQGQLYMIKEEFLGSLEAHIGKDAAGLMRGVMFGEKTDIGAETLEEFRKNGTAHVLAVSGLHVGIIYGFLSMLWIWKKGRLFFSVIIVFFILYMVMASFSPSVVRAVIMVWLHIFAKLTNRRYDMASAAFFTALLMLADNPMHLFNTGFQMSFLAVLTLSLMMPIIKRFYSGMFMASIAVQLGLMPYTIYIFNYISLATVFVNVPVIFLTGIIGPAGMCGMLVLFVCEPLFDIVAGVLYGLCHIMTELNSMTGIDGITVFDVKSPPLWIVAFYYLVLLVFVSEDGRLLFLRKKWRAVRLLTCVVLILSLAFGLAAGNAFKKSDVVFVDVGQGACVHFRTGKSGDYMIDGGGSVNYNVGEKTLKPYLLKNGADSIDGAFVTHLHTDHYKGIAELCREGMVEKLYLYEGYSVREKEVTEDTGLDSADIIYLYAGQRITLDDDVYAEVLWPERKTQREYEQMAEDETDENQFSLILKLNVRGQSVLVTGDVDAQCLDTVAGMYGEALDSDILQVAHHGSKYSESAAFAEAAAPEYAVFQVGKNNFGHPDKGVVENLRGQGIIVYRNDKNGAVAFDSGRRNGIRAKTVK